MSLSIPALMVCAQLAQEPAPTAPAPQAPSPVEAPAVGAINGFGIDLYKVLAAREPRENLFFSPLSTTTALTMVAEGARDETAAEMVKVLHLPTTLLPAHEGFAALGKRSLAGNGTLTDEERRNLNEAVRELVELRAGYERDLRRFFGNEEKAAEDPSQDRLEEAKRRIEYLEKVVGEGRRRAGSHELRIANALWLDQSVSLLPAFTASIERHYGAGGVSLLDFAHQSEAARQRINMWVEEQTRACLREVIPAGGVGAATRFVVANAIYFLGTWKKPFPLAESRTDAFTLADGSAAHTLFMHRRGDGFRYAAFDGKGAVFHTPKFVPSLGGVGSRAPSESPPDYPDAAGFTMVEIPYDGGTFGMVVVLPRSPDGLAKLEQSFDVEAAATWCAALEEREVDVTMPRFQSESAIDLSEVLGGLGMERAFSDRAQFGGITNAKLCLGSVWHKAWVSVDEAGTVAAAATAVEGVGIGVQVPAPFLPVFRADRPFLFLIRDTASGAILFVGRVVHPRL